MNSNEVTMAGFSAVKRSPRRLIASIQGPVKAGKTRLALTAKKPIGLISIEIGGDEGVVDQFIPKGSDSFDGIQIAQIRMENPDYPDRNSYGTSKDGERDYNDAVSSAVSAVAASAMDRFYAAYYASLANFPTTVIDTGSDLWELHRLANFGRLEKIPTLAYTQLNKAMDKVIDDAFSYPGNVIFLHHLKEKWETFTNDKGKDQQRPSGIFEMAGYGGIKKKVQAVIELWKEDLPPDTTDEETGRLITFHASIIESRHSADATGMRFRNDFDFGDVCSQITKTPKKDWL